MTAIGRKRRFTLLKFLQVEWLLTARKQKFVTDNHVWQLPARSGTWNLTPFNNGRALARPY